MSEEENIEISNNIHEQRNEKRKKKKRRGKILNPPEESKENVDEYNAPLMTISSGKTALVKYIKNKPEVSVWRATGYRIFNFKMSTLIGSEKNKVYQKKME